MNKNKLKKLQQQLISLRSRKRNISSKEMIQFANACGRKLRPGGIGKEPTYINIYLPYSYPLSIPNHQGNIPVGTAGNILDNLEKDLFNIEENLENNREVSDD